MAITNPEIHLSRSDKEILLLLGGLLTDSSSNTQRNYSIEDIPLSNSEALRLADLLEELVSSKKFIESAYFIEELSLGHDADLRRIKSIFKNWRIIAGRSRSMSWLHWEEFKRRFSKKLFPEDYSRYKPIEEMDFKYFLRMEKILLSSTPLNPRVASMVLRVVEKYEHKVQLVRNGNAPLKSGSVSGPPLDLAKALRKGALSDVGIPSFSGQRIAGVVTLVANTSVLFTTRDWGVAGTLSTIAGAVAISAAP